MLETKPQGAIACPNIPKLKKGNAYSTLNRRRLGMRCLRKGDMETRGIVGSGVAILERHPGLQMEGPSSSLEWNGAS